MKQADLLVREMIEKIPILAWSCQPDGTADFPEPTVARLYRTIDGSGCWLGVASCDPFRRFRKINGHVAPPPCYWRARRRSKGAYDVSMENTVGSYFVLFPIRDEEGRVVRWYGTNTDIEDRKWAETLLAGENRL